MSFLPSLGVAAGYRLNVYGCENQISVIHFFHLYFRITQNCFSITTFSPQLIFKVIEFITYSIPIAHHILGLSYRASPIIYLSDPL